MKFVRHSIVGLFERCNDFVVKRELCTFACFGMRDAGIAQCQLGPTNDILGMPVGGGAPGVDSVSFLFHYRTVWTCTSPMLHPCPPS